MTNQLDKLPSELLMEVLSWLPKVDLKQARLSCHRLRNAGDRWLFQRLYFAPREMTMDVFNQIAANPAFSRYITELIYDGRLFQQQFLEPEMYYRAHNLYVRAKGEERERALLADCERAEKEIRRDMRDIKRTGSAPSEREQAALKALRQRTYHGRVFKSMKQYVQFYIQQENILDTGRDKNMLLAGMKQMPNIYKLSIIDHFAKADHPSGVEHSWYKKRSRKGFGCSLAPMGWPARYRNGFRMESDDEFRQSHQPWDCRGIVNILKAAATHNSKIDKLEFGLRTATAPTRILHVLFNDQISICNMARGLRYMVLHLSPAWFGADFNHYLSSDEVSCLQSMLQQSKELISLDFDVPLLDDVWKDVFSGLYFPRLITLQLGRLSCWTPTPLIGMLERHKASLRELSICGAKLNAEEGSWEDVAQRLGHSLNLRYVLLSGLEEISEVARFHFSPDSYLGLAMLLIPSCSPHTHYIREGFKVIELVQKQLEPDPLHDVGVKTESLV